MQVLTELYVNVLLSSILPKLPLSNAVPPSRRGWSKYLRWNAAGARPSDPCLDHWFFVSCNAGLHDAFVGSQLTVHVHVHVHVSSCVRERAPMHVRAEDMRTHEERRLQVVQLTLFDCLAIYSCSAREVSVFWSEFIVCPPDDQFACRHSRLEATRVPVHKPNKNREACIITVHTRRPSEAGD